MDKILLNDIHVNRDYIGLIAFEILFRNYDKPGTGGEVFGWSMSFTVGEPIESVDSKLNTLRKELFILAKAS